MKQFVTDPFVKTQTKQFVTDPLYLESMAKILIKKKEGIIENISYDRRAYESVDDNSHS